MQQLNVITQNYFLEYQKNNSDKYLVLDRYMFLIDYFDINNYLSYN
jgi:hypothetical protein